MRKLKALEIAEGALLVDIALVFQIIALLLPTGSGFFYILVCIVFSIVVLRHGVYVGIMSLIVGMFVVSMLSGPQMLTLVLLEGLGGIFLGATMRWRWHPLLLVLLGAFCGALALYSLILGLSWILGLPLTATIRSIHELYTMLVSFVGQVASTIGLGTWWRQQALPVANHLGTLAFQYWWVTFYLMLVGTMFLVVPSIYIGASTTLRSLGYDVRPLFGGKTGHWKRRIARRLLKRRIHLLRVHRQWEQEKLSEHDEAGKTRDPAGV